jgi:chaperonin GroEL
MTATHLPFESAAREAVRCGPSAMANAVRVTLENAMSVASTLLLAEATLTEMPEPRRERVPTEPGR